jgi:hypothetical protein
LPETNIFALEVVVAANLAGGSKVCPDMVRSQASQTIDIRVLTNKQYNNI